MHGFSFDARFLLSLWVAATLCACGDSSDDTTTATSVADTGTATTDASATTSTTTDATSTSASSTATGSGSRGSTDDGATGDGGTGGGQLVFCSEKDTTCPDGFMCFLDECPDCMGNGVCVPAGGDMCGGFAGLECPEGDGCLMPGSCVADAFGACVPLEMIDPICAAQKACWSCG